jgi:toxin secretion/phage lysis holin
MIKETTALKHLSYITVLFAGLSLESYGILAVLMLIDTFFGVLRVGVVHGWRHVKSYKLSAGVISKITVIMLPALLAWVGRGAGVQLLQLAESTLCVLILAEFYSILGNVYSIRIRKDVQEFDAVSAIIKGVRTIIERLLKKDIENIIKKNEAVAYKHKKDHE